MALLAVEELQGLLADCQDGSSRPTNLTTSSTRKLSPTSNATPSPTRQPSPTAADWAALARSLQGTLVRPGSSQYPTALQLFNTLFDSVQPVAIAYCASPMDVQTCLSFAHRFGLPLVPRSGGHSYAGYSTTI